tara:strand:- start:126 stop:479 length:354 start_codon:yes stop_codon:yes gene_type:complete
MTVALEADDCPFDVTVIEGHRTLERQAELYAIGRTTPGSKVTNAKPGQSRHNSMPSEAVDVGPCDARGQVLWNDKGKFDRWAEHVKATAERLNIAIRWGGDFSFYDGAHYELVQEGT